MPNEDTWEPLLVAVESSDCQAGTVAIIPPVPKPVTMRATMNCPNEYEVPMSLIPRLRIVSSGSAPRSWHQTAFGCSRCAYMAPINCTPAARKMVLRRPRTSPRNVQARDPKTPNSVNNATTVPKTGRGSQSVLVLINPSMHAYLGW